MPIHINVYGSGGHRWFSKAARAALRAINEALVAPATDLTLAFGVEFDPTELKCVRIREQILRGTAQTTVVFAASDWSSLAQAISPATEQLASAVLALAPAKDQTAFSSRFAFAGLKAWEILREKYDLEQDDLIDFYIYIDAPLNHVPFVQLIEAVDSELQAEGVGEVSGNSYALNGLGSCIDIVARVRGPAEAVAVQVLRRFSIVAYTCSP